MPSSKHRKHKVQTSGTKSSGAHQAVQVPELLYLYLQRLSKRELVSVARVCRKWSAVALDELWSAHEVPLSALLDKTLFLEQHKDEKYWKKLSASSQICHLNFELSPGSVDPIEWRDFVHQYSHKVTRIWMDCFIEYRTIDLLQQLLELYGGLLCPNITALRISEAFSGHDRTLTASLLVGSALSEVVIGKHEGEKELENVTFLLSRYAPRLRVLTLGPARHANDIYYLDSSPFTELQKVDMCDITCAAWRKLTDCPKLEEIRIYDSDGGSDPLTVLYSLEDPLVITFPSLRKLDVGEYICQPVLTETVMPALRTLVARHPWNTDGAACVLLSERSRVLEEVDMFFQCELVSPQTIELVSRLRELRELKLGGRVEQVVITDSSIHLLARSLPFLQVLSIAFDEDCDEYDPDNSTRLTQRSLFCLARHPASTSLRRLELSLDLSNATSIALGSITSSAVITHLTLCHLVIPKDTRRLARVLATCCPLVSELVLREVQGHQPVQKRRADLAKEFTAYRVLLRAQAGM